MKVKKFYDPTRTYVSFEYEELKSLTDDKKKVIGNRMINEGHIKLFTSYSAPQLSRMPALTVNIRTGRLIDGQHRVRAIVKMIEQGILPKDYRYDVMLIDVPEEEERTEVINANIHSKGWTQLDYITFYMQDAGDEVANNYKMLDAWCRNHPLTAPKSEVRSPKYRYASAMMKGISCSTVLKTGDFKVTLEELREATEIHNELYDILSLMDRVSTGTWLEYMALAWFNARRDTDFNKFKKTLKTTSILNYVKGKPSNTRRDWDDIFAYVKMRIK